MRVIYHPEAAKELIEAAQFYEERVRGLGTEFLDAADRAVGVILNAPERWRVLESDVRQYLMPRFPYAVYYRVLRDHIRVLAFKHHSRHPSYWRDRLP
jgi:hypothetical protein